ncbi:MAG: DUF3098 domain-containing protein [Chitinophagales bacterium]|nr:DUF3098 domain-containing protein [Chitinophagales bacterium]
MAKKTNTTTKNVVKGKNSLERLINRIPRGEGAILFNKTNYILMGIGVLLIVLGFILMAGKANPDPTIFDVEKIYSTRRISVAPAVVLLGFVVEIFAIMKRPSEQA